MFYAFQPVGHGHITCSLTLTEKHRHMVSENKVPRNISTYSGGSNTRLDETVCWAASWFLLFFNKYFSSVALQPKLGLDHLILEVCGSHTISHTKSAGLP